MGNKVGLDLRVHPDNPSVTIHHFLVEGRFDGGEHIGCFVISQAWTGKWTNRKEMKAWNSVQERLSELEERTGLVYSVAAHGTLPFCERAAKEKGWVITA